MNVKRISRRTLATLLSVLLLLSTLVAGTTTTASATTTWSSTGTSYLYFDYSSLSKWTKGYGFLLISNGTKVFASKLTGELTDASLAYKNLTTIFSDYNASEMNGTQITFVKIINTTSSTSIKNKSILNCSDLFDTTNNYSLLASAISTYKINSYSANYNGGFDADSQHYCLYPDDSSVGVVGPCSTYTGLNYKQTVNITGNGGVTGTFYSFNSGSSSTVATKLLSSENVAVASSVDVARASSITLTATASGSCSFLGWYSDSTYTTPIIEGVSGNTYTYTVDGAKTVYAKFSTSGETPTTYAQNVTVYTGDSVSNTGGTVTLSAGGANQSMPYSATNGASVTLTASPAEGYVLDGFYTDSNFENKISEGVSGNAYTYSVSGEKTVYAKFILDPTKFNFYSEGAASTKTSKIFFVRPDENWSTSTRINKVFILLYTDDSVYSVQLPQVKNSSLNAASAHGVMNNAQKVNANLTWTDITDIAFIQLSDSETATSYSNKELVNGNKKENKDGTVVKFNGITTAAMDATTAENNGIACYTGKYSTAVADGGVLKYHYFEPATSSNGANVDLTTLTEEKNIEQKFSVAAYGGYVSATSFIASNAAVNEQVVSDAVYADPISTVTFNAAYTSPVTLTPIPNNNNYRFEGWYSDAACSSGNKITSGVEADGTYTYTVKDTKTVYAKFVYSGQGAAPAICKQDLVVKTDGAESSDGGSVVAKFDNTVQALPYYTESGASVTLTAYPSVNYVLDGFYDGETKLSSSNNQTTYNLTGNKTITAKFVTSATSLTQTVTAGANGSAYVSTDGTSETTNISVAPKTSVIFKAVPNANYHFEGWYTNSSYSGKPLSTETPYTILVNTDNTLYAKFAEGEAEEEGDEGDDTTPPEETAPSNRNDGKRNGNATLSAQAQAYYTSEVSNIAKYKTADSGESGVYKTFMQLSALESNAAYAQNSFDVIYKNSNGDYDKDPDENSKFKYLSNNSLYTALYDIMSSTHTHAVSYAAYGKNSLAHYWMTTDSSKVNWSDSRGVYTFFYSDVADYNHKDMQREHIWPKSKASFLMKTGLGGSDLHHLRPAYGKLNLLKLNWGFASIHDKSGWKITKTLTVPETEGISLWRAEDQNGETFIDVKDDVRGDVARILLYIYTRWREPNLYTDIVDSNGDPDTDKLPELDPDDSKDTGERVFYDLDTLLDWMKNDPVSEWEMKRNDLTQDIQGNRNVFIDYPELAWLMLDQTVPSGMATPSGMAGRTDQQITENDINKVNDSRNYNDKITLDFTTTSNGEAEFTAYNATTGKAVKNGDIVDRGDSIIYTIVPNQSTIKKIYEFSSDSDGSSNAERYEVAAPETTGTYSFTKQAGYFNGKPNISYKKERVQVSLNSGACELNIKINSKTATGNSGGSGSGMVTARKAGTSEVIENGSTVANGTRVTLTFTPGYGSRVYGVTYGSALNVDEVLTAGNNYKVTTENYTFAKISGTDSYTYTTTLDCSNGNTRERKFTVYFAQTFNANDKVTTPGDEYDKKQHINNKGMRPDAEDKWGDETDFTTNFEICGVQIRNDKDNPSNNALRFVSVIDQDLLSKAKSYGYVLGYTNQNLDTKTINRYAYTLTTDGANSFVADCTETDNQLFGDYGKHDTVKNYKYVTVSVNNIQEVGGQDTVIIARPYVELKDEYKTDKSPSVIYGQYVDFTTGENFCACSGSYNKVLALANSQ